MSYSLDDKQIVELSTFYMGDILCGIDIRKIQEINKMIEITKVPTAPDYVHGVLNLRGQIVTVIDVGKKIGISPAELGPQARNIIVNLDSEFVGILVDRISDVVRTPSAEIEPPPSNLGGANGSCFGGVVKLENSLVGVLDIEAVLKMDDTE